MDGRKQAARAEAQPFYDEAAELEAQARAKRDKMTQMRKAKQTRTDEYKDLKLAVKELDKEAKKVRAKGEALETAVYDLKAVNPNNQVEENTRTPDELIAIIEAKGQEVAAALALLMG